MSGDGSRVINSCSGHRNLWNDDT